MTILRCVASTAALAALLAGCYVGPSAMEYELGLSPAGVQCTLRVGPSSAPLSGELLALQDTAAVVLSADQNHKVWLVPYSAISGSRCEDEQHGDVRDQRLRARYPNGISTEVFARLLAAYGQTTPMTVTTTTRPNEVDAFLAAARQGTARYKDRTLAIADGYRPVGPDSPGMGEHWVDATRVLAGRLDPVHPQVLTYIIVDGTPVLAGVAYALPTRGATGAPSEPAGREWWHFHGGTVEEEGFLPDHHHAGEGPGDDTRVAVLHVWAWVDNPVSLLEPDNWALPFTRLHLTPPPGVTSDAGRAISLATVGEQYFLRELCILGRPDSGTTAAITAVLAARRNEVARWLAARHAREVTESEAAWLDAEWKGLWDDLRRVAPDDVWSRLAPARSVIHSEGSF